MKKDRNYVLVTCKVAVEITHVKEVREWFSTMPHGVIVMKSIDKTIAPDVISAAIEVGI